MASYTAQAASMMSVLNLSRSYHGFVSRVTILVEARAYLGGDGAQKELCSVVDRLSEATREWKRSST
jgi:hypothetical protein